MSKNLKALTILSLTTLLAAGCGKQGSSDTALLQAQALSGKASYLVSSVHPLPANFREIVSRNGDTLQSVNETGGFAAVQTSNPNAYRKYADIVVRNATIKWIPTEGDVKFKTESLQEEDINPPNSTNSNTRFNLLWGMDAVNAPEAWAQGVRGKGVRVAVLDSGIDRNHPDLVANLNTALSRSFVQDETYDYFPVGKFNHGTHVAGTIAAVDNNIGVIGVAPSAEIVAVKVLSANTGSGSFGGIISGIMYAADIDADVINMSLGGVLKKSGFIDDNGTPDDTSDDVWVSAREVAEQATALSRATTYAYQKGTTIIASEGNDAIDKDHTANVITLPADSAHVLSISATSPIGWALDPSTNLSVLTSYSNYGASAVNFAAPGGDSMYPGNELCTVAGLTRPCWVFDLVLSTNAGGGYAWAGGTSMAAPHASGIAALIIGQNGGSMKPAQVAREMAKRALDLGKPGNDPAYGGGHVNSGF